MSDESKRDEKPASGLLKSSEVAALYRVDPKTVARWVLKGKLKPAFRTLGGHARFREADIRALLEGGEPDA